jgi:hypothetical protein
MKLVQPTAAPPPLTVTPITTVNYDAAWQTASSVRDEMLNLGMTPSQAEAAFRLLRFVLLAPEDKLNDIEVFYMEETGS